MSDLITPVESFFDGSVARVRIEGDFQDHARLVGAAQEADFSSSDIFMLSDSQLPDPALKVHPCIQHDQREGQRDPVAIEYWLHLDGVFAQPPPLASLVVAREAAADAPPTRLVSTVGLYALARDMGVFQNFDVDGVDSIFGKSPYYREIHALLQSLEPDDQRLQAVMDQDLARSGASTREEMLDRMDQNEHVGLRPFPLVGRHSTTGQPYLMVDAGVCNAGLRLNERGQASGSEQGDVDAAYAAIRLMMADNELLRSAGIMIELAPQTGYGVAFTRETLHCKVPPATASAAKATRQTSVLGLVAKPAA